MSDKKSLIIGLSLVGFIALFVIFEYFTFGGFRIFDYEYWARDLAVEEFEGSYRPILDFYEESKTTTIIPVVLRKILDGQLKRYGSERQIGIS